MNTRVASIHFAPVTANRNYRGNAYQIPAVPLNADAVILECNDLMQYDEGPVSTGPGNGRRQQLRDEVLGEDIARCLVIQWTEFGRGMTPDAKPGIWVVRDRIPVMREEKDGSLVPVKDFRGKQEFRPATQAEAKQMWDEDLAAARRVDRAYAEWCYGDGNRLASINEGMKQHIPPNYKLAGRQYGFEGDWVKGGSAIESKPCPHCGVIVSKSAMVCKQCTQPIDLEKWAKWTAAKDMALREAKGVKAAA